MKRYRSKKRRFHGNRHTGRIQPTEGKKGPRFSGDSASARKLNTSVISDDCCCEESSQTSPTGNRILDIELLLQFVKQLKCPNGCSLEDCSVSEKNKAGLYSKFIFKCSSCGEEISLESSSLCVGRKHRQVNVSLSLATFTIGRHMKSAQKFCGNMNLPAPVKVDAWRAISNVIHASTKCVANETMKRAAKAVWEKSEGGEIRECTVSCDNTWQKRLGFSSKNGISTVLTADRKDSKVVDVSVRCSYCDICSKMKKKKTEEEFKVWFETHKDVCHRDHHGSAGMMEPLGMEPLGMEKIFKRSVEKHSLMYTGYLGDGDSKSYVQVSTATPPIYPSKDIVKYECCGHVQKKMFRRLDSKAKAVKIKVFKHEGKNVKGIGGGGKGKLSKKVMLQLQGHYGAAIREDAPDVEKMKRAIWATFKHKSKDHSTCGEWCPAVNSNDLEKANKNALAPFVLKEIEPIYKELAWDELIKKCAHGSSQNTNDAVCVYNEGELCRLNIFHDLGIKPGIYRDSNFREIDRLRVQAAEISELSTSKQARKDKSLHAAKESDRQRDKEGQVYASGEF